MDEKRILALRRLERPARYLGGEIGAVVKSEAALRFALLFPDQYEVAESHLGLKILYSRINDRPDLAAERIYAPGLDLRAALKAGEGIFGSLESGRPLGRFDVVGVSLQYEASYATLLEMLALGQVPLLAEERAEGDPLVIAGGPCAFNPEPLARFLDAVVLGDGEEVILEIADALLQSRGESRTTRLQMLSRIPGVYVPSLYEERRDEAGRFLGLTSRHGAPPLVEKRIVADLDAAPFPESPVLPHCRPIHDRLAVEIQRGCTRGCRFCHAGMVYRPTRQRSARRILELAARGLAATGHEELGLLSLSAGDHPCINELVAELLRRHRSTRTSVSLPSLRVETLAPSLAEEIRKVRKTGFTIAPEAGSERLRRVLNKGNTEEELLQTVALVSAAGWRVLKLYFMIGLPTETEADVDAIAELVHRCRRAARGSGRIKLNISLSAMVPKTHTPFQWEAMPSTETLNRRFHRLADRMRGHRLRPRWQDPEMSLVEAALARGDRRVGQALLAAHRAGHYLDSWSEHFDAAAWRAAFDAAGLDLETVGGAARPLDEPLPWDHLSCGVERSFLLAERERAMAGQQTADCSLTGDCLNCGVCDLETVAPKLAPEWQGAAPIDRAEGAAPPVRTRMRLTLAIDAPAALLSHLETSAALARALRRAGWPLSYSEGFHPQPRIAFEWARPVGLPSRCERVDVELCGRDDPRGLSAALQPHLPPGISFVSLESLPGRSPSLASALTSIDYEIDLSPVIEEAELELRLRAYADADTLEVHRPARGKSKARTFDLKQALQRVEHAGGGRLCLRVRVAPQGTPRTPEILAALCGLDAEASASVLPIKIGSELKAPPSKHGRTASVAERRKNSCRTSS